MKTCSVVVCYNPDIKNLLQLCQTLNNSCATVIIVDNTEKSFIASSERFSDCTVIPLGENKGIACAQNIGINCAIKAGADIVVFFDQDSSIENDFLSHLLAPLKMGEPRVLAPVFFDREKGYEFPSLMMNMLGWPVKVYRRNKSTPYHVDVVISSGSAATVETFDAAGMMDEDFFIDGVDTEWCLRCRANNIPILVVPSAMMQHSIGERSVNFGLMRGFIHSPERSYYKMRNCFLLFRKKNVPFLFALKETLSMVIHHIMLLAFYSNRMEYMKIFWRAVSHGVMGVVGKRPA